MTTLKDKLDLFAFAQQRQLVLTLNGEEFGYAKGPVLAEEFPKEPLLLFYRDETFFEELAAHLDDLTEPAFSEEEKKNILRDIKFYAICDINTDKKEYWWHQLCNPLKTWLLHCVVWRIKLGSVSPA